MSENTARELMKLKLQNRSVADLKDIVEKLFDNYDNGADIVSDVALGLLQNKISETEFISFCDNF